MSYEPPLSAYVTPVDIIRDATSYTLYADVPGVDRNDLQVFVNDFEGTITITGHRFSSSNANDAEASGREVCAQERFKGETRRRVTLHRDAHLSDVTAAFLKGGVLRITIPRHADTGDKSVPVVNT